MKPRSVAAAVVMLTATCLSAQQTTDGRLVMNGRVLDRTGQAWGGATVTLIARPIPEYPHVGDVDELQVTAAADGTFSARVLTFRRYSAWAHQGLADGSHRLTGIADDVSCGAKLELREREANQLRLRLQVDGIDKVTQWGPLTHRLVTAAPRNVMVRELLLDARAEADIPPLPGTMALYEVLTPTQVRLFTAYLPLTQASREQHLARMREAGQAIANLGIPADRPELSIVHLPEPTEVTIRVRDSGADAPVAAATIALGAQGSAGSIADVYEARPIARTDKDGIARVPMLLSWTDDGEAQWPRPSLLIHSDTHGERYVRSLQVDKDETEPTRDKPVIEVKLRAGAHAVQGRLWLGAGKPAADAPILVYQRASWISNQPYVHRTDSSGRFCIPGRPANAAYRLTALVPHPGSGHLQEVYLLARQASDRDVDLGDVRLDEFVTVHCLVQSASGAPAGGARLYLGERLADDNRLSTTVRIFTDAAGFASLQAPPGAQLALFVAHDDGFAISTLDVPTDRASLALEVRVAAATWVSGQVVDDDGKPLPRAVVSARCWQHAHDSGWRGRFLDRVCNTTRELNYRSCYSDNEGRFRLPFADTGSQLSISAWKYDVAGESWQAMTEPPPIVLTEEPIAGVRVVLSKRGSAAGAAATGTSRRRRK